MLQALLIDKENFSVSGNSTNFLFKSKILLTKSLFFTWLTKILCSSTVDSNILKGCLLFFSYLYGKIVSPVKYVCDYLQGLIELSSIIFFTDDWNEYK